MTIHLDCYFFQVLIRNICGFLIQVIPCAFFCIYPFTNRLVISSRKVLFLGGISLAVLNILFLMPVIFMYETPLRCNIVQTFLFYLSLLVLLILYFYCINAYAAQKLFVFTIVMDYGFLVSIIINIFDSLLPSLSQDGYKYNIHVIFYFIAANGLLFYPMLLLMKRIRHSLGSPVSKQMWKQFTCIPSLFILTACCVDRICVMKDKAIYRICLLSLGGTLVFMLIVYYYIFSLMDSATKSAFEQFRLEKMLEDHLRYAENANKIRKLQHETKHHINALNLYMKNKDYAGAEKYLDRFSEIATEIPVIAYTPHPLLNSLLLEYKERAVQAGIRIIYHISVTQAIEIDDMDLCCLLSNCMDNALESCSQLEPAQRLIRLQIRQDGYFLFFSCENSCNTASLQYQNGILLSTKKTKDGFSHGFGLSIMNEIASKYNGAFRTKATPDTFTTIINLCLSGETAQ